jgi:hypothetical protein
MKPGEGISYLNRNSIRNDHERRQGSQEDIPSYLNRNSIRNNHRERQDSKEMILNHI